MLNLMIDLKQYLSPQYTVKKSYACKYKILLTQIGNITINIKANYILTVW